MYLGIRLFHSVCPRCRAPCSFTRQGDAWVVSCHCGRHRFPWSPGEELFAIDHVRGISDRSRVVPVVTRRGIPRRGYPVPRFNRFHAVGLPEHQHRLRRLGHCLDSEPIRLDSGLRHRSRGTIPAAISPGDIASLVVRRHREALLAAGLRICARYRERLDRADIRAASFIFIKSLTARMARAESRMLAHWRRWRDSGMRSAVHAALLAPQVPASPICTTLNDDDIRLADTWPRGRDEDDPEWSERVRSARAAERAARIYYASFPESRPVVDISLSQLDSLKDTTGAAWRCCDLTVSGRPIDVKNVRFDSRSESRTQLYSEYLLQSKYYRAHPLSVTILGVRTRSNDKVFESQILGEWDVSIERSLFERARSITGAVSVEWIPSRQTPASLPGWLLEYPRSHYSLFRRAWVESWSRVESRVDGTIMPLWLAAIADAHGCSLELLSLSVRPRVERELLRMLSEFFDGGTPSRPSLVLFVLIWLSHAGRNGELEPAADALQRAIWGSSRSRTDFSRPLALCDPLEYVRSWMDIFLQLWRENRSLFDRLRSLRLVGRGLLRGKFDGEHEEITLVAYCGGCGRYPLVLGCVPACGCSRSRLRCPWCFYCHRSCARCNRRLS